MRAASTIDEAHESVDPVVGYAQHALCTAPVLARISAFAECVAELREMFVRRYSVGTRPWIPFHPDAYELTVNVANPNPNASPNPDAYELTVNVALSDDLATA